MSMDGSRVRHMALSPCSTSREGHSFAFSSPSLMKKGI
uniref:Uncharacterized protein n=1 Tax=Rhizophora mucronata TaxID=61149 RepID=A0A2P2PJA1_RHIMU